MPTGTLFQLLTDRLCANSPKVGMLVDPERGLSRDYMRQILVEYGATVEGRSKLIRSFIEPTRSKLRVFTNKLESGELVPPFTDSPIDRNIEDELVTLGLILVWVPISERSTWDFCVLRDLVRSIERVHESMLESGQPLYRVVPGNGVPEERSVYPDRYQRVLKGLL